MVLLWTNQLSVGNAVLDAEHRKLLGMINSIEYAVGARDCPALLRAIRQFIRSIHTHFENEARFADALEFSFSGHELDHQHLRKELGNTEAELEARGGAWPEYVMDHYAQFLREWLIGHITTEDMQMKHRLEIMGYGYQPA